VRGADKEDKAPHELVSRCRSQTCSGSSKETQYFGPVAYATAILDKVVTLPIRVDLLKFHGSFANNASHQVQERAAVIVHPPRRCDPFFTAPVRALSPVRHIYRHYVSPNSHSLRLYAEQPATHVAVGPWVQLLGTPGPVSSTAL
jgi:hypothetical protein